MMHAAVQIRSRNRHSWRLTAIGLDMLGRTRSWLSTQGFALALCATVLIAAALRVYKLDYQSLWSDEIFSLITTDPNLSVSEFWARVRTDTHPPIYYLLLRLSSSPFGQSELAARAPSAGFGILTLCAPAAAAWYDRETRPYALLLLLSTLITLACLRFVGAVPGDASKARRAMTTLTAAAVLASFTHYFGFLVAAAGFATCRRMTGRGRKAIVAFAGCSILALFAPWVLYHSRFVDTRLAEWIISFPLAASMDWFSYLSFGGTACLAVFVAAALVLFATRGWREVGVWNTPIYACTLVCVLTLAAAVVISLHTAILTSRNMIVVLPALYVISAELA